MSVTIGNILRVEGVWKISNTTLDITSFGWHLTDLFPRSLHFMQIMQCPWPISDFIDFPRESDTYQHLDNESFSRSKCLFSRKNQCLIFLQKVSISSSQYCHTYFIGSHGLFGRLGFLYFRARAIWHIAIHRILLSSRIIIANFWKMPNLFFLTFIPCILPFTN